MKHLQPHEIGEVFDRSVIEAWRPYTDQLNEADWYVFELFPNHWEISSPFQCSLFYPSPEMAETFPISFMVKAGLNKMERVIEALSADKPNAEDISVAMVYVEKSWKPLILRDALLNVWEHCDTTLSKLSDVEVWDIIKDVWVETEGNSSSATHLWREILTHRPPPDALQKLPEEVTLYRGGQADGLSWTTDYEQAVWYQRRNTNMHSCDVPLMKSVVAREDILFEGEDNEYVLSPNASSTRVCEVLKERYEEDEQPSKKDTLVRITDLCAQEEVTV